MPSFAELTAFFFMLVDVFNGPQGVTAILSLIVLLLGYRQHKAGQRADEQHLQCTAQLQECQAQNNQLRIAVVRLYETLRPLKGVDLPPLNELLGTE